MCYTPVCRDYRVFLFHVLYTHDIQREGQELKERPVCMVFLFHVVYNTATRRRAEREAGVRGRGAKETSPRQR